MKPCQARSCPNTGSVLVTTVVFASIMTVSAVAMLKISSNRFKAAKERWDWSEAYYHAENGLDWAAQVIADSTSGGSNAPFLGKYSKGNSSINLSYLTSWTPSTASALQNVWVTIENHSNNIPNLYLVTSSAMVGGKTRTIEASVLKNPPSQVFDYEYFLNNWGWWWGASIYGWGPNRANWDFDFRSNPTVNGSVLANGNIEENGVPVDPLGGHVPFIGLAGTDPTNYVHSGVPRLPMPNLLDFSYYQQKAIADGGTLQASGVMVSAVHSNLVKPGLYLVGTAANPITINGPVVVPGDVVIKGTITGVGTLYVGGNLYIAGNLTYANGPNFSTPPETMSPAQRDAWVQSALAANKDLVGFAVREAVFAGAPNSSVWYNNVYKPSAYGLKNVGSEISLGEDGIRDTPDDGIPFTHPDGSVSAWYDADGDGVVDGDYNYNTQIKMTQARALLIDNYPTNAVTGLPQDFNSLSSNRMNRLDGIIYCNHAAGMRLQRPHSIINGAIICRDEAIVFNGSIKIRYDSRVHSRYWDNPNNFIDLGLPVANRVRCLFVQETAPLAGWTTASVPIK